MRDVAQAAVVAGTARPGAADLLARADVALLRERTADAVELLARAGG